MGNKASTYKHASRKVPYRSEKLEISKSEHEMLAKWLKLSADNKEGKDKGKQSDSLHRSQKVIFDTDIGTDIDDSLALLMLLHLPAEDVELLGITTVYGHTSLRAAVAKAIVDAYYEGKGEASKIPVISGEGLPLGTHRDVWHTGTEGMGLMTPEQIIELQKNITKPGTHEAANFIIKQVLENPGEVVILCLGGLSNVAVALRRNPAIIPLIKRIVYMGMGHRMKDKQTDDYDFKAPTDEYEPGFIYFHYPNHNISCDTLAAVEVFRSGVPVAVVNDAVTNNLWFGLKPNRAESVKNIVVNPCAALAKATAPPECKVVGALLAAWLDYRSSIFHTTMRGTCPHDAITTAEAIYPGRFAKYVRGRLLIHEWAGFSSFVLDPLGPHEIGHSVEASSFLDFLVPLLVPFWSPPPPAAGPSITHTTTTSTAPENEGNATPSTQSEEKD